VKKLNKKESEKFNEEGSVLFFTKRPEILMTLFREKEDNFESFDYRLYAMAHIIDEIILLIKKFFSSLPKENTNEFKKVFEYLDFHDIWKEEDLIISAMIENGLIDDLLCKIKKMLEDLAESAWGDDD
jgi:hypothetical protein